MKADYAPILWQIQAPHFERSALRIKLSAVLRVLGFATKFAWPIFSTQRVENWVGSCLMREKRLMPEGVK